MKVLEINQIRTVEQLMLENWYLVVVGAKVYVFVTPGRMGKSLGFAGLEHQRMEWE